jgi:ornithine cyclodeaminase
MRAVLVLSQSDVVSLLDLDELRRVVATAMADVSAGRASMPARIAAQVPERTGLLAAMPAYLRSLDGLATKLVSVFPQNAGTEHPTHQAVVVVFDAATGTPAALLDGTFITAARTAAGAALSTELLARNDARVLTIVGTGVQARSHAHAVTRVRRFDKIRIWGRNHTSAHRAASDLSAELNRSIDAVDVLADACEGSDVICATTNATEPVVTRDLVPAGAHVTSVGYNVAGREIDSQTVVDSLLVVESRQVILAPPPAGAPDITIPIDEGRITADHIHAELGELIAGGRTGRTDDDQITLYKSVGVAAQDVAAATLVLQAARDRGIGLDVTM